MRRRGYEREPSFIRRGDGPGPEAPPEEEPAPKTVRERVIRLRRDSRAMLAILPRAFALVWNASRGLTLGLAVLAVVGGIIPTATAWVSKLLVDSVLAAAESG